MKQTTYTIICTILTINVLCNFNIVNARGFSLFWKSFQKINGATVRISSWWNLVQKGSSSASNQQQQQPLPLPLHQQQPFQQESLVNTESIPNNIEEKPNDQYVDNKYKLSTENINEFESFMDTLNKPNTENPEINKIKNAIETISIKKVNNLKNQKIESDLDYDTEEFNTLL